MASVNDLRKRIRSMWKQHKKLQDEIRTLKNDIENAECELAVELEKEEWKDSNEDRKWW